MTTNRLVRNSIVLIAIEVMAKGLGLVFFAMVARFLGAGELGLYAFATAMANFIALPAKFGFETLVQREVGRHPANTYGYFWEIGMAKGLISLGVLGLYVLVLQVMGAGDFPIMVLVAAFTLVFTFMEFTNAFFRANQKPELEMTVRTFFSVSNLVLGALVLYGGWRLTGVVSSQLVSVGAAVILGVYILTRIAPRMRISWDRRLLWGHLTAAAPFAGILVALFLSNQMGIIILTPWAGKEDVGYFAAAFRLFDAMTLIPAAIMGAFLPIMSQLYVRSLGGFVRTLRFTMKYLFILALPLVVVTVLLAPRIIVFLYREAFAPSALALQVLSLALFFSFWNFASESVLVARNQERSLLGLIWLTAGIHVTANLVFIPAFSYMGACWAVLATQGAYCLILFCMQVRRYLGVGQLLHLMALPALSAVIMGAVVFWIRDWHLLVSIPVGLLVYTGALLAVGAVRPREMDLLHGVMQRS